MQVADAAPKGNLNRVMVLQTRKGSVFFLYHPEKCFNVIKHFSDQPAGDWCLRVFLRARVVNNNDTNNGGIRLMKGKKQKNESRPVIEAFVKIGIRIICALDCILTSDCQDSRCAELDSFMHPANRLWLK